MEEKIDTVQQKQKKCVFCVKGNQEVVRVLDVEQRKKKVSALSEHFEQFARVI
jgi:hypothetical protein